MTATKPSQATGIIYQAISGFYYVWSNDQSFVTKPRGNFRHLKMKPLVGDYVVFEPLADQEEAVGRLVEILPRQNALLRPPVANVDFAIVVSSLREPEFSYNLLDYFLVFVESHGIQPIILLTKYDLLVADVGQDQAQAQVDQIRATYQAAGYDLLVNDQTQQGLEAVKHLIQEGTYVVMGQSGVGKSTLLNQLIPAAAIETGAISSSLNRGKHTTREVTLYRYHQGLIADTPGFSAVDLSQIAKEDLGQYFPEIHRASLECRFRSCLHINEPGCQVKALVDQGQITASRYQNYQQIFAKLQAQKPKY